MVIKPRVLFKTGIYCSSNECSNFEELDIYRSDGKRIVGRIGRESWLKVDGELVGWRDSLETFHLEFEKAAGLSWRNVWRAPGEALEIMDASTLTGVWEAEPEQIAV